MTQPNGTGNAKAPDNPNRVKTEDQLIKRAGELAKAWREANQDKRQNTLDIALTVYNAHQKKTNGQTLSLKKIAEVFNQQFGTFWSLSHFKKLKSIGASYENGSLHWLLKESSYVNRVPYGVSHLYYLSTLESDVVRQLAEGGYLQAEAELKELKDGLAKIKGDVKNKGRDTDPYKFEVKFPSETADVYHRRMQAAQKLFGVSDDSQLFMRLLDYVADYYDGFAKAEEEEKQKEQQQKAKRKERRDQQKQDRQDSRKPLSERKNKAGQQHRQDQQADHKEPEAA